jgi:hypothetical protein
MIPFLAQILSKIGANSDAAAMNTTLFAGQQKIDDDLNALVSAAITTAPTEKSLRDILHKDGNFTYDHTTDSLEALRDKLDTGISGVIQEYTTGSGNWVVPSYVHNVDVLIVGGGGGGAGCGVNANAGGGGGGGGEVVLIRDFLVIPGESIPYVVGAGGSGGSIGGDGTNGAQSSFAGIIAAGGEKGLYTTARTGGKGGSATTGGAGGAAMAAGGNGTEVATLISRIGGGGGGGGYTGSSWGGNGGMGLFPGGTGAYDGGGGGGGSWRAGGNGTKDLAGVSAVANSGGGGGGAGEYSDNSHGFPGGNGGSGYVLIFWR